jgi:hypothetical protein
VFLDSSPGGGWFYAAGADKTGDHLVTSFSSKSELAEPVHQRPR